MVVVANPEATRESKPHYRNIFVRFCLSKFTLGIQMARLAKISKERMHSKFYSYYSQHSHHCPVTIG